jgi:glucose dehydrogenase
MNHLNAANREPSGNRRREWSWLCSALLCAFGLYLPIIGRVQAAPSPANVDAARITHADQDPGNWLTYGRTYSEQRFSPLTAISADNANRLGLAWYAISARTVDRRRRHSSSTV